MKIKWDQTGEKTWGTGVSKGVLYPYNSLTGAYDNGVGWNGLTAVNESPSGAEKSDFYADNVKYAVLRSAEDYGATIEAYTYPKEFAILDGSAEIVPGVMIGQQNRGTFGFSYQTLKGNDTEGQNYGYEIHIIYGATASPSEKSHSTVNDSPELETFSWEIATTPVNVTGYKPTATLVIDSTLVDAAKLSAFEDILYGTDGTPTYSPVSNGDVFSEVADPSGNPVTKKYYERSGISAPYTYSLSADTEVDAGKTYYTAASPSSNHWFVQNASSQYVPATDVEYDNSKSYYVKTSSGGTVARLPLPDEVSEFFA